MTVERVKSVLLGCAVGLTAAGLLLWPGAGAEGVQEGLLLCGGVLIPALFPFLVLSSLAVELGFSRCLGTLLSPMMYPLFRVNGSCGAALALGLVGGYPVGARTAVQLYESGQCSKAEAERLLAFCNNCGPAFTLGVVGVGLFGSSRVGLLLCAVHVLSALLVGILFRFYGGQEKFSCSRPDHTGFQAVSLSAALTRSVAGAVRSSLSITGFVLTFSVLLRLFRQSGLMGCSARLLSPLLGPVWAERFLTGFLELSSGVSSLTDGPPLLRLTAAAWMLGWGGLSVHGQVLAFLGDSGLSARPHFFGKILQGCISSFFILLFVGIFHLGGEISCFSPSVPLSVLDFYGTFRSLFHSSFSFWSGMMILSSFTAKYAIEKHRRL